jgi:hypothetical protein
MLMLRVYLLLQTQREGRCFEQIPSAMSVETVHACDVHVDQSQSRGSGVLMHDLVGIIRPVLELFMVRYVQAFEAVNLCHIHSWRVP